MSLSHTVDLEDVKQKLYERLKPSGWGDKLKTFIMSEDFDKILKQLLSEVQNGERFTPVLKQVFRAFEECPYDQLKVVMVGQDPYPYIHVADGIAFSCSNTGLVQPSLKFMFKELENTVYPDGYEWNPDLTRWANQGILMLNTALTTSIGKIGSHYKLWDPFIAFVFDILGYQNPGLIYVFMGKKAQEWMDTLPDNNFKLTTTHPASAAHTQQESWNSGDMFNKVSELTQKYYKYNIIW